MGHPVLCSGARVEKINQSLQTSKTIKNNDHLFVSVGSNNIGENGSELAKKFDVLINNLKSRNTNSVLLGILPRLKAGPTWNKNAEDWNVWLNEKCAEAGVFFADLSKHFKSKKHLYVNDGVHLSQRGKLLLANELHLIAQNLVNPFLA